MRRLVVAIALLGIAVTVCIWRLPASLIALAMTPETGRFMQLHEASGTLWNGRARLSINGVPPTLAIAWQCRPSLSPPGARCQLNDSVTGSLHVNAMAAALTSDQLAFALPLNLTPAAGVSAASTRVAATVQQLSLSQSALSLKAMLRADDARYRIGSSDIALGEVTVDCTPNADGISSLCTVANRGGSARLDGRITVASSKASGTLELTPANGPVQRVSF